MHRALNPTDGRKATPTAEAVVATDRPGSYIAQLCRHLGHMRRPPHRPRLGHADGGRPPQVQHVEYTDTEGLVRFRDGRWTLRAAPDGLALRLEAQDEESLHRLREAATARLEGTGGREGLTVDWLTAQPGESSGPAVGHAR